MKLLIVINVATHLSQGLHCDICSREHIATEET